MPEAPRGEAPQLTPEEIIKEKEWKLENALCAIQLLFADKKWQEHPVEARPSFLDVVADVTAIVDRIKEARDLALQFATDDSAKQRIEEIMRTSRRVVETRHAAGGAGWEAEAARSMLAAVWELRQMRPSRMNEKPETIGSFYWNLRKKPGFESVGISKDDDILELHVESLFKSGTLSVRFDDVNKHLSELAERIVKEYPSAKAVVGYSWLLDHPLARRLGFHILDAEPIPHAGGMSLWMQFVNKDGELDKRRSEQLLKTGEFPYHVRSGYIPIEEFLQRYLPESYRGREIELMEVDPDRVALEKRAFAEVRQASRAEWDDLTPDMVEPFLMEKCSQYMALVDACGMKDEVIGTLREAKTQGIAFQQLETWRKLNGLGQKLTARLEVWRRRPGRRIRIEPQS